MLFNSYEFIFIFLPITFLVYFHLNSRRLKEVVNIPLVEYYKYNFFMKHRNYYYIEKENI